MFYVKIFHDLEMTVRRAFLRVLIGKNIFLGRAQIFPRQGTIFLSAGGANADLLMSIKFTKVQTEGGVRGVSRLIVALSHKDYPCVSI